MLCLTASKDSSVMGRLAYYLRKEKLIKMVRYFE
jgi:hypothetical protein